MARLELKENAMYKAIVVITFFAVALMVSCGPKTKRQDAAADAQKQSELSTNQDQARLWKEANKQGLEKIPQPGQPVQLRQPNAVPNVPSQSKPAPLPQGLQGGVRIISLPQLPGEVAKSFAGTVQIRRVEGELIELDLGGQGLLSLYARARGGPLRAKQGEQAQLDLRFRDDPFDRQLILALRLVNGDGVVSALDSGDKPVTVKIPLFKLVSTQTGAPEKNLMNVLVTAGGERKMLSPGQIVEFPDAGLTVGLVGSDAFSGESANAVEGRPYALNIVAWPTK
jgi:hypothetical protein